MRKIIVYIDCDTCHQTFPKRTSAATGSAPSQWQSIASNLEYFAQLSGWHCYHNRHDCFECILETMHPSEFTNS